MLKQLSVNLVQLKMKNFVAENKKMKELVLNQSNEIEQLKTTISEMKNHYDNEIKQMEMIKLVLIKSLM